MLNVKYVRTENDKIIVFPKTIQHSEFKSFNPVSAGFIKIGMGKNHTTTCSCYGESLTLGLKSKIEDTNLARKQILEY